MKSVMNKLVRDEKGAALIVALILLLVGGLLAASLLGYMGSGLLVGKVYDTRTAELYAADAGVEDAIWSISHESIPSDLWRESGDQPGWWIYEYPEPLIVNGKSVDVTVYRRDLDPTCGQELIYRILATAVTDDGGNTAAIVGATTVESYLSASYMDFSSLLDYAIVSQDTIDIRPNVSVNGSVWLPNEANLSLLPTGVPVDEVIYGEVDDIIGDNITMSWPDAEALSSYYWAQVDDLLPSTDNQIDIPEWASENNPLIVPRLSSAPEGEQLTVKGDGWIKLGGTIYVKGDLVLNANPEINLNLNGQTIFAEGEINIPPGVTLSGSGCIIAVGNIDFRPGISSNLDDFVLVLSIGGMVTFQPNGNFTGCVAGNEVVQLQPAQGEEFTLLWISPENQDLDFPMGIGDDPNELPPVTGVKIDSWEIIQQ